MFQDKFFQNSTYNRMSTYNRKLRVLTFGRNFADDIGIFQEFRPELNITLRRNMLFMSKERVSYIKKSIYNFDSRPKSSMYQKKVSNKLSPN